MPSEGETQVRLPSSSRGSGPAERDVAVVARPSAKRNELAKGTRTADQRTFPQYPIQTVPSSATQSRYHFRMDQAKGICRLRRRCYRIGANRRSPVTVRMPPRLSLQPVRRPLCPDLVEAAVGGDDANAVVVLLQRGQAAGMLGAGAEVVVLARPAGGRDPDE